MLEIREKNPFADVGSVPWSNDDLIAGLDDFARVYRERPIQDNAGGLQISHSYFLFFVLRWLKPETVVESGVWLGHSTWLIEQAVPDAHIYAIEPSLARIAYRSPNAEYRDLDFGCADWRALDPEKTVLFFDDHQSSLQRLQECAWWGFRHLVFDDNYSPPHGDCYSLRRILSGSGFRFSEHIWPPSAYKARRFFERYLSEPTYLTEPNEQDRDLALRHIETYYEFPPVVRHDTTRWGDSWDIHDTKPPLFDQGRDCPVFSGDKGYTWMAYVQMKSG